MKGRLGPAVLVMVMVMVTACAGRAPAPTDGHGAALEQLEQLERSGEAADRELDQLEHRVVELQAQLGHLEGAWERVELALAEAEHRLAEAKAMHGASSATYGEAVAAYDRAAQHWRAVAAALMIAASSDKATQQLCEGKMSRAQVRRHWQKTGINIKGKDADHIWPNSRGGADHLWNFQALEARINRSIGNGFRWKLMNQPLALLRGAAVSALVALRCA